MVRAEVRTLATMVDFSERLSAALAHAGTTSKDLQDYLGISYQAMKKLESGLSKSFTAENCARAARYLRVNWFWLATGEGAMLETALPPDSLRIGEVEPSLQKWSSWPFASITPDQYGQLSDAQRGMVEGYASGLLAATGAIHIKSDGTHGGRR